MVIFFKVLLFGVVLIVLCIYNTSSQRVVKHLGLNEGTSIYIIIDMHIDKCTIVNICILVET